MNIFNNSLKKALTIGVLSFGTLSYAEFSYQASEVDQNAQLIQDASLIESSDASPKDQSQKSKLVIFEIKNGVGRGAWNLSSPSPIENVPGIVELKIGDTLRIVNNDKSVPHHQLHTNGTPFEHGRIIKFGQSADYKVEFEHDPVKDGPLYDHGFGAPQFNHVTKKMEGAAFWVRATR